MSQANVEISHPSMPSAERSPSCLGHTSEGIAG